MTITLLSCTHEFYFVFRAYLVIFHLSGTEILKDGEMRLPTQHPFQFLCHSDTTAHHHDVDIVRRTFQKDIPDVTANDITLLPETVCRLTDLVKNLLV